MHLLARRTRLIESIDRRLHLLKVHKPYHESDHVLNMAYNPLAGGECLEDIELWRNDEVYLDALGAQRIPDPTTAGDFCRRFEAYDIQILMRAINAVRLKVWKRQPKDFFERAIIDAADSSQQGHTPSEMGSSRRPSSRPYLLLRQRMGHPASRDESLYRRQVDLTPPDRPRQAQMT